MSLTLGACLGTMHTCRAAVSISVAHALSSTRTSRQGQLAFCNEGAGCPSPSQKHGMCPWLPLHTIHSQSLSQAPAVSARVLKVDGISSARTMQGAKQHCLAHCVLLAGSRAAMACPPQASSTKASTSIWSQQQHCWQPGCAYGSTCWAYACSESCSWHVLGG